MRRQLRTLRRLGPYRRRLIVEAALWLAVSRAAVLVLPFRRLAPHLGHTEQATPPHSNTSRALVGDVSAAVRVASRFTPFKTPCLAEAMAAQQMLKRRRVQGTIHLGLDKKASALSAHAWLTCGDTTVTGAAVMEQFVPIASFTSRPRT